MKSSRNTRPLVVSRRCMHLCTHKACALTKQCKCMMHMQNSTLQFFVCVRRLPLLSSSFPPVWVLSACLSLCYSWYFYARKPPGGGAHSKCAESQRETANVGSVYGARTKARASAPQRGSPRQDQGCWCVPTHESLELQRCESCSVD